MGQDLLKVEDSRIREIRGKEISMIFQDPMTTLNPVKKIKDHFVEFIKEHQNNMKDEEAISMIEKTLESVGISKERINDYPHQFSGGMRQRVMIALAIILKPKLLIADEPTTALDVLVEAQILELIKSLKKQYGLTVILITHNMGVVAEIADRVAVMYAGKIVELSEVNKIYTSPKHPYTKGLIESIPSLNRKKKLTSIPGSPPDLTNIPSGCSFRTRCPYAFERCITNEPELEKKEREWYVACHLY